ncbi:hypothetical protein [Aliidongia dinghuensis]|nr:hypothetical protein [Aliidongia dinghuensis]
MAPPKPTFWGPYLNEAEARTCLSAFAAQVIGPGTGVIFCDGIGAAYLQQPFYDADGSGLVLVATCRAELPPPPPSPPAGGVWQKIERFFENSMTTLGEQQMRQSEAQLAMGQQEAKWLKEGWTSIHEFVEGHKTAFDGAAVVGDVFGLVAGVVAGFAMVGAGVTLLPALAVLAGFASLALLAEDGRMFVAEIKGDEVRKKQIENSRDYKIIELICPLLLLPDLVASGPRAVASITKTTREVQETREVVDAGEEALNAQRAANDAYQEAHASKLGQNNIKTKVQRMHARANKLARALKAAQERLADAQREFIRLRVLELPAYAGSIYAQGLYAVEPPDYLQDLSHGGPEHAPAGQTSQSPHPLGANPSAHNPMNLLIPKGAERRPPSHAQMSFQVAVSHNAAAAKQ